MCSTIFKNYWFATFYSYVSATCKLKEIWITYRCPKYMYLINGLKIKFPFLALTHIFV